jgi:hypothetical protein
MKVRMYQENTSAKYFLFRSKKARPLDNVAGNLTNVRLNTHSAALVVKL